eukprot:GCRY01001473.1.p1 GENE.GCRY01001473.1~~GCRY01001473.1.p1  ORF type:complete len:1050 (+),score=114.91 GCRY01001473.1:237-3386(+)
MKPKCSNSVLVFGTGNILPCTPYVLRSIDSETEWLFSNPNQLCCVHNRDEQAKPSEISHEWYPNSEQFLSLRGQINSELECDTLEQLFCFPHFVQHSKDCILKTWQAYHGDFFSACQSLLQGCISGCFKKQLAPPSLPPFLVNSFDSFKFPEFTGSSRFDFDHLLKNFPNVKRTILLSLWDKHKGSVSAIKNELFRELRRSKDSRVLGKQQNPDYSFPRAQAHSFRKPWAPQAVSSIEGKEANFQQKPHNTSQERNGVKCTQLNDDRVIVSRKEKKRLETIEKNVIQFSSDHSNKINSVRKSLHPCSLTDLEIAFLVQFLNCDVDKTIQQISKPSFSMDKFKASLQLPEKFLKDPILTVVPEVFRTSEEKCNESSFSSPSPNSVATLDIANNNVEHSTSAPLPEVNHLSVTCSKAVFSKNEPQFDAVSEDKNSQSCAFSQIQERFPTIDSDFVMDILRNCAYNVSTATDSIVFLTGISPTMVENAVQIDEEFYSFEDDFSALMKLFPGKSTDELRAQLTLHHGNIDKTIDFYLNRTEKPERSGFSGKNGEEKKAVHSVSFDSQLQEQAPKDNFRDEIERVTSLFQCSDKEKAIITEVISFFPEFAIEELISRLRMNSKGDKNELLAYCSQVLGVERDGMKTADEHESFVFTGSASPRGRFSLGHPTVIQEESVEINDSLSSNDGCSRQDAHPLDVIESCSDDDGTSSLIFTTLASQFPQLDSDVLNSILEAHCFDIEEATAAVLQHMNSLKNCSDKFYSVDEIEHILKDLFLQPDDEMVRKIAAVCEGNLSTALEIIVALHENLEDVPQSSEDTHDHPPEHNRSLHHRRRRWGRKLTSEELGEVMKNLRVRPAAPRPIQGTLSAAGDNQAEQFEKRYFLQKIRSDYYSEKCPLDDQELFQRARQHFNCAELFRDELEKIKPGQNEELRKLFKLKAQRHRLCGEACNRRARNLAFTRHNSTKDNSKEIDLHNLNVPDALSLLAQFLSYQRMERLLNKKMPDVFIIITGKGLHSDGGVAKIKPAVIDYLEKHHYVFEEMASGGALRVYPKN